MGSPIWVHLRPNCTSSGQSLFSQALGMRGNKDPVSALFLRYGTEITSLYDHTNPKRERGVSAIGKLSPR